MLINGHEYLNPSGKPLTGPEIGFIQKCARDMNLAWEPVAARPVKAAVLLDARLDFLRQHEVTGATPDHLRDAVVTFACERYREANGAAAVADALPNRLAERTDKARKLRVVGGS